MELLQKKFVPVAVDEWYHARRDDDEGKFYQKVVFQREGLKRGRTTQGFYAFSSDGTLHVGWNNRDVAKMRRHLRKALEDFKAPAGEKLSDDEDPRFARPRPEGGSVADVHTRILEAKWPEPKDEWEKVVRRASGRDHLWITKAEVASLVSGSMPESLARRIARFHCIDNTRGEPPMWEPGEVRELALTLKGGRLSGSVKLSTDAGDRGYEAECFGWVEARGGKLSRFDLVARGSFWGEGTYTPNAPPGKFTLGIAFTLAADVEASKVPPQGARDVRGYLGR